jgi:LL-diaminopimelate aminotransferase
VRVAQRVQNLPAYVFATLGKKIQQMEAGGDDVIRLDIGSPDLVPAPEVLEAFCAAVRRDDVHGYPSFAGEPAFRQAVADYYGRRFGVTLNPETEVLALIGSKEGIAHVPTAFVDPGAVVLVPDPGYPAYTNPTLLAGGEVYSMPLLRERDFLPDLEAIPAAVLSRAQVMWLNYPHNPTAAVADLAFLERAVAFAKRHDLLLAYDNPYSEVVWSGTAAPSILQIPAAREVALEFNSLSKMVNMAGWRIGMAVGNAKAVGALGRVKNNMDTGVFPAIQEAAVAALNLPAEWIAERNLIYRRRREVVVRVLDRMRIWYTPAAATLYVWCEIPMGFESAAEFADALLVEAGVSVAPGTAFGPSGEGYVRISLVQSEARLEEALDRWERWLIGRSLGKPLV